MIHFHPTKVDDDERNYRDDCVHDEKGESSEDKNGKKIHSIFSIVFTVFVSVMLICIFSESKLLLGIFEYVVSELHEENR